MHLLENGRREGLRLRNCATVGESFRQRDTAARAALADVDSATRCVAAGEENEKPVAG